MPLVTHTRARTHKRRHAKKAPFIVVDDTLDSKIDDFCPFTEQYMLN